jgi:hypothetical protein
MKEVGEIKTMLQNQKNGAPETVSETKPEKASLPPEPREISIDFEAWMKKKYK